jgi:hypothetical protein
MKMPRKRDCIPIIEQGPESAWGADEMAREMRSHLAPADEGYIINLSRQANWSNRCRG